MRTRNLVAILGAVAVVALGLLVAAAARPHDYIAFSLDVNPYVPAASLAPGQQACQGPVRIIVPVRNIVPWVTPVILPGSPVEMTVHDYATGTTLASGQVPKGYTQMVAPTVIMNATLAQGRVISFCARNLGPKPVDMVGDIPNNNSGTLVANGQPQSKAMALLLYRPHPVTLLSQLPNVFRRAALFRPGWVGSWTFWILAILLAGAFGGVVVAVRAAQDFDLAGAREAQRGH